MLLLTSFSVNRQAGLQLFIHNMKFTFGFLKILYLDRELGLNTTDAI